uniref:Uncharacterized protein n=1 Tax=Glossina austeni TaxID=7395 RepID=A0A1A9UN66_GLOAU
MKIYRTNCNVTIGCKHKFEPAIIAASISPTRNAVKALSKAYIELEQAVSNKYEGPCKPKLYEIRFANKARLQPVILKPPGETLSDAALQSNLNGVATWRCANDKNTKSYPCRVPKCYPAAADNDMGIIIKNMEAPII